jgi:asparagine synthase (glutamine-hydrolysing)
MRHSIETRLPFLDYRLVEFAVSLPVSQKIRVGWTKYVLRTATQNLLPHEVVWRRDKVGFESPTSTWMRSHLPSVRTAIGDSPILRTICDVDALLQRLPDLDPVRQWQFFNLACWERIFAVRWPNG